jgi:hypothetical protein
LPKRDGDRDEEGARSHSVGASSFHDALRAAASSLFRIKSEQDTNMEKIKNAFIESYNEEMYQLKKKAMFNFFIICIILVVGVVAMMALEGW